VIRKVFSKMYDSMKHLKFWAAVLAWVIGVVAVAVILFPAILHIIFRVD
jgi:hypothetical protein